VNFLDAIQAQIDRDKKNCEEHGWEWKNRTVFSHTIGDFISAVMVIDNEQDAQEFYSSYIDWLSQQPDRKFPEQQIADMNIGWCFGEGMALDRQRMWHNCTHASHPIFGRYNPTVQEAWKLANSKSDGGQGPIPQKQSSEKGA
jgi:hypothetical protein